MKAAILKAFGQPLVIEEAPDPVAAPGEVIVDIAATPILPYMVEVLSGARAIPRWSRRSFPEPARSAASDRSGRTRPG